MKSQWLGRSLLFAVVGCSGVDAGDGMEAGQFSRAIQAPCELDVQLTFSDQGNSKYCAEITVTNPEAFPTATWSVDVDAREASIQRSWGAARQETGTIQTFAPFPGESSISPGGTTVFGFCAFKLSPEAAPTIVDSTCSVACPADADQDGYCDSIDICPGGNDAIDTDEDGTPDACDVCPADPMDDSDGDGVCDSDDMCPGADDAADQDGDGVCDALDRCPGGDDAVDENGNGTPDACDIDVTSCAPGLTGPGVIDASVVIDSQDTAADIAALDGVWCITGDLHVNATSLTDLSGLGGLRAVGGEVDIGGGIPGCEFPCSTGNDALTSLNGLEGLERVGSLTIYRAPLLATLAGLSQLSAIIGDLRINRCPALQDLTGLGGLSEVPGHVVLMENGGLRTLGGLDQLTSVGAFDSWRNPLLEDISALGNLQEVTGQNTNHPRFLIIGSALLNLEPLGSLTSIRGTLALSDNANLQSLHGLESLEQLYALSVWSSPSLTDLSALSRLTRIPEGISIGEIGASTLEGLQGVTGWVQQINVSYNPLLTDLEALSALTGASFVSVSYNASLTSLAGLRGINEAQGLLIEGNAILTSLGLDSLLSLQSLQIADNPLLTQCEIDTLVAQTGTVCEFCTGNGPPCE